MGEYGRIEKKQESSAVANNGGGGKQLKGIVDSRFSHKRQFQTIQLAAGDCCYIPNEDTPYMGLPEIHANVGPYLDFTAAQRSDILKSNAESNDSGYISEELQSDYNSDTTGKALITKDVINHRLAEVDHIIPKSKGGGNTVLNAQLISSEENTSKGNTYPYGGYVSYGVFDPTNNVCYNNKTAAVAAGAKNANLLP